MPERKICQDKVYENKRNYIDNYHNHTITNKIINMNTEDINKIQFIYKVIYNKISAKHNRIKKYIAEVIQRGEVEIAYKNIVKLDNSYISPAQKQDCVSRLRNKRTCIYKEI